MTSFLQTASTWIRPFTVILEFLDNHSMNILSVSIIINEQATALSFYRDERTLEAGGTHSWPT